MKKLEEWEKQYRLDHPIYNLVHGHPPFYTGIVSAFILPFLLIPFQMGTTFITRYALFCFVVAYVADWFCRREMQKAREKFLKFNAESFDE